MAQMGENTERERRPLSFPQWKQALATTTLPQAEQSAHQRAIIAFLGYCKKSHAPASIILIQSYLKQLAEQERSAGRAALRWFVLAAERLAAESGQRTTDRVKGCAPRGGGGRTTEVGDQTGETSTRCAAEGTSDNRRTEAFADCERLPVVAPRRQAATPPPTAAADLGGAQWERALIKACRERHFLWRTEETYRMWGSRFARFLAPRSPHRAEAADVAAFLSRMAVEQRASVSAQKQALNALVFLLQEALHRQLGRVKSFAPRGLTTA